jgi:hypothetical protein
LSVAPDRGVSLAQFAREGGRAGGSQPRKRKIEIER